MRPITLTRRKGRLFLRLVAIPVGEDWLVHLTGGSKPHVGAAALASPQDAAPLWSEGLCRPEHREGDLALSLAQQLAQHLHQTVCVVCGIHLDHISPQEIQDVLHLSHVMAAALAKRKGKER